MKSKLSAALAVAGCSLSLGAALPLTVSPANADSVYNINFVDITGTVTTDGTTGTLSQSDILAFSLSYSVVSGVTTTIMGADCGGGAVFKCPAIRLASDSKDGRVVKERDDLIRRENGTRDP